MQSISVFNNKGGVGKTTLTFHLAHALAELGKKTLIIDFDPQCNLTIFALPEEMIYDIWSKEDPYIDDFSNTKKQAKDFQDLLSEPRSTHFLLKPTEDGTGELDNLPPPVELRENLSLVPGRLTLHLYEEKISSRWSDVYQGDPLAIRTVNRIRSIADEYAAQYDFDIVIYDTSPSLGSMNKVIISLVDGFIVPCNPDMFSLYGIRNIGNSLYEKKQFDTIFHLLSDEKRGMFPEKFVSFLGFTVYNARRYTGQNDYDLATAHYNFAQQIPETIKSYIKPEIRSHLDDEQLKTPIGQKAVMHSHATLPSMAQKKYHPPIWLVPSMFGLEGQDKSTISGNRGSYEGTQQKYHEFAVSVLERLTTLS